MPTAKKAIGFPKPAKIRSTKAIKKSCDTLTSLIVRHKAHNQCQLKGLDNIRCSDIMQCMHIEGRGDFKLRFDRQNLICGCSGHHVHYTAQPAKWIKLIQDYFPERWAYLIEQFPKENISRTRNDYLQLERELRQELKELQSTFD